MVYDIMILWYDMIWYDMIWYDMMRRDATRRDTIYDMIWYDMIYEMIFTWRHLRLSKSFNYMADRVLTYSGGKTDLLHNSLSCYNPVSFIVLARVSALNEM